MKNPFNKRHPVQDLQVLAVDCQTTGGNASQDHLVEIGWMVVHPTDRAGAPAAAPVTHIVKQPLGIVPPTHILKLTGLDAGHFKDAVAPAEAWHALKTRAKAVASANGLPLCPTVIHYARFEMAFLNRLHTAQEPRALFPMEIFCSHQMAVRLWPDLPRKGLRAIAGYLGHSVPIQKRCAGHLQATAAIWRRQVDKLVGQHNVTTLDQLRRWMQRPGNRRAGKRIYPMPRPTRLAVPTDPGIYRFRRSNGDLLYIGKATSLKSRVNSYFQASRRHSEATLEMLTQAVELDVTPAATALEAALLESDEIKRLAPPYNKALRSDQRTLRFLSRDFGQHAGGRNHRCPIGPVTSPEAFTALHAMGQVLTSDVRGMTPMDIGRLLCMPERYAPGAECLQAGLDLFLAAHGRQIDPTNPGRDLMRIGHRSWRDRLASQAASAGIDTAEEEIPADDEHAEPFEWSPPAVMDAMTSILRRCGFMLRRSRWLCMLSESTVAWRPTGGGPHDRRLLAMRGGSITDRQRCDDTQPLPVPPGVHTSFKRRQANLDLPIYDRLRVLTTELRRLVAEARPVAVRINGRATLTDTHLSRLFRWI